jgi:hypothetical protein
MCDCRCFYSIPWMNRYLLEFGRIADSGSSLSFRWNRRAERTDFEEIRWKDPQSAGIIAAEQGPSRSGDTAATRPGRPLLVLPVAVRLARREKTILLAVELLLSSDLLLAELALEQVVVAPLERFEPLCKPRTRLVPEHGRTPDTRCPTSTWSPCRLSSRRCRCRCSLSFEHSGC